MITFNGLPLYRVALGSQDGVVRVSLVDDPAVQSQFEFFRNADKAPAMYAVQDEERRIVRGVILRADYPIFRRDTPQDPGYYVTFSAEVIRAAAERLLAEGHANDVNLMHEDGSDVQGVQMVQLFVKDSAAGIDPEGFEGIADGSLFAEYHVTNDDVWDEIKAGTFKGFSVEIFYTLIPASGTLRRAAEEISGDELAELLIDFITTTDNMSRISKLKTALARIMAQFGSVTTDKGVIYWDGEDDLKAGDRVQVEDADGNRTDAADGEYVTSDGKTIVVTDGVVAEIRDPEAEVSSDTDDDTPEQMAAQRRARFEESYDEKMRKIAEAIRAARGNREDDYGYLADAGDDFAVWAYYGEDTGWEDHYIRYRVTWNGDEPSVSDPVDCRRAFVPMDFDDAAAFDGSAPQSGETVTEEDFAAAVRTAESLQAENATLKARIAELEKTPAKQSLREKHSAEETFAAMREKRGGRLESILAAK